MDSFSIERLYLMVFVHAGRVGGVWSGLTAAIPSLVSRHEFTAANALLQTTTSIGIYPRAGLEWRGHCDHELAGGAVRQCGELCDFGGVFCSSVSRRR